MIDPESLLDLNKLFKIFLRHYPDATRTDDQFTAYVTKTSTINGTDTEYVINVYAETIVNPHTFGPVRRVVLNYQGEVGSSVNVGILTTLEFKHAVKQSWRYYETR